MNYLILETSQNESFVALVQKECCTSLPLPSCQQRDHLFLSIEQLLSEKGLSLRALDFIAVASGPGSFTGARIGHVAAQMLSFANDLPLLSFCSFLPFTPPHATFFFVLCDAKAQGVYVYDGTTTLLQKELSLPSNVPLFSPHPEKMTQRFAVTPQSTSFSFPLLLNHLKEKFLNQPALSPAELKISYLHSPCTSIND